MSESGKPVLVVSDVHIGAVPPATERAFRAFLDFAAAHAAALVINGDLFDVWVPSRRFIQRAHARVIAALADAVERGLPVTFVGGNHDALEYTEAVLREDAGVRVLPDPARTRLGPFTALVAHGDGVRPVGRAYRKEHPVLRALLRNARVRSVAERLLPEDWVYDRVASWSRVPGIVARHARGEGTGPKRHAPRVEAWAREQLRRLQEVDLVLVGHSHLPAWIEVEPGRFYVNTGDWIEHWTYALLPASKAPPEIRRWPDRTLVLPDPYHTPQHTARPAPPLEHAGDVPSDRVR
jgi:UDP-2,3-diacylglucosamine hydrolase